VPQTEMPLILVVEDEELIRSLVEETLREGGFEPAIATAGEEAVTLLKGHGKYRALVTDINLKGQMDGWEVAQHAREIEPDFPIVYMSGTAAADWTSKGVPNSIMLSKPFAPAQLLTAVANLLNSGTPTT
jgi:CheY-like chemotaxis protein